MVSLRLDNVSVSFPGRGKVMDRISFQMEDEGIACILGPTGCGKTTTLKVISGIVKPDEGRVEIGDAPVGDRSVRVGYVFQEPRLLPWRSALGNVEFGTEEREADRRTRIARSRALLEMVGLGDREDDSPSNLSGGEKQRLALARALAGDPMLLLMDEPFSSLDVATRRKVQEHFVSVIEKSGKTTIFVTHDIFEALSLADRLIVYSSCPARVKADIALDDGKPRDPSSPRMLALRQRIVDLLEN